MNTGGFLYSFSDWNEDVARAMAQEDGFELNDCHWAAIRFQREYYHEYEVPASQRIMIREVGSNMCTCGKCNGKTVKKLFPMGGCKQACRIAGVPMNFCISC